MVFIAHMNGNYKEDDTIGKLMHEFGCKESGDMHFSKLAKEVRHFKEEESGRKICKKLCSTICRKCKTDSLLESIKNLMESMKWSAEQVIQLRDQ